MKHTRNLNDDAFETIVGNDGRRRQILRDQRVYRAGSVMFMDSAMPPRQPSGRPLIADAAGRRHGLNQPGWRIPARDVGAPLLRHVREDAQLRAVDAARVEYETRLTSAWKGNDADPGFGGDPSIAGFGERGTVGQREGDLCTINGEAGRLARGPDGKLFCMIARHTDAAPEQAERLCPDCDGSGEIDGEKCDTCGGNGMVDDDYEENAEDIVRNATTHTESARHRDHRTVVQMMRDHQNKMADIYNKLDYELSEKWRRS